MERWKKLGPEQKASTFMVVCQLLFMVRGYCYWQVYRDAMGPVVFLLPFLFWFTILYWLGIARGIWKKQKWASNHILLPTLFLLLGLFMIGGRSWSIHWSLAICWGLELLTLLGTLVQIARVPGKDWEPTAKRGWRKIARLHVWALAFWLLMQLELWLVVAGFEPGKILVSPYFHKVEELTLKEDYFTDEDGIIRLNALGAEVDSKGTFNGENLGIYNIGLPYSASTFSLYEDLKDQRKGISPNAFTRMLDSLRQLSPAVLTAADSAYLEFGNRPINDEGFRSIPFRDFKGEQRKRVLLIGDSFTFGWSARPWTGSFADELSAKGHIVYNSGITATDPAQYEAVAKKYIPQLKPDVVIVNLFLGNDIMHYPREVGPGKMPYYPTNAGVMMAAPMGEYFEDAEEAYTYYKAELYLPEDSWLPAFVTQTTLGALTWKVLHYVGLWNRLSVHPNSAYHERNQERYRKRPYTEGHLKGILEVAKQEGSECLFVLIPEISNPQPTVDRSYPGLFEELSYFLPEMESEDFNASEEHFNLQGHQKYARFLDQKIQELD